MTHVYWKDNWLKTKSIKTVLEGLVINQRQLNLIACAAVGTLMHDLVDTRLAEAYRDITAAARDADYEEKRPFNTVKLRVSLQTLEYCRVELAQKKRWRDHDIACELFRVQSYMEVFLSKDTLAAMCADFVSIDARSRRVRNISPTITDLARDIIGDPWNPIQNEDIPQNEDVSKVAASIYQSGDFADLPYLADALLDAGLPEEQDSPCDCAREPVGDPLRPTKIDALMKQAWATARAMCRKCDGNGIVRAPHPILAHLRSNQKHAVGCHALDAVLGLPPAVMKTPSYFANPVESRR